MAGLLRQALTFALIPVGAALLGGTVATYRPPNDRYRSYVQHFAAGVVFAAVAGELLPDLHDRSPSAVVTGFAVGVALMLLVRRLGKMLGGGHGGEAENPTSFLVTVGVDVVVDGVLIGVAFAVGTEQGVLVSVALALELLVLSVAVVVALSEQASQTRRIAAAAGLGVLVLVGVAGGVLLFGGLSGAPMAIVIAFGAAALLYLVTEELLTEAHEVAETPTSTAMFFAGFLALFLIEMA